MSEALDAAAAALGIPAALVQRAAAARAAETGSSVDEVLAAWSGLGYNRRALFLREAARCIVRDHEGRMPGTAAELQSLPGVGPYTAGATACFAYGEPVVIIETNIRSVFLHFFFNDKTDIHDRELFPLIEKTLWKEDPRSWYYGLMDYGARLKKLRKNPSRQSRSGYLEQVEKALNATDADMIAASAGFDHSVEMGIFLLLVWASSVLGSFMERRPFLKVASTFSRLMPLGRGITRWKEPYVLSRR